MKISLIGPTYPFRGGISHYTTLLFDHLCLRHDVQFFSFKRQYPKWLFPGKTDLDPSQIPIKTKGVKHILDSMNPFTWVIVAWKIIKSRQDLLIIPWWVSFWAPQFFIISFFVKLCCRTKILFLCHNVVEHESKWIDKILTRMVLKHGDMFIVHSSEDYHNLLTMIPDATVEKSFHPTYDVFNTSVSDTSMINREEDAKEHILLFFGFVREYKGLKYLINAMPDILDQIPVTLLVVGEFWKDKDDYLRLIKELDLDKHVTLVDAYVPNESVGKYFRSADLIVQPYVSATGSGVIQAAFGFNKPVVATAVGSLPEIVEHGKTGYLVMPKDVKALSEAIIRFFKENKYQTFSQNIANQSYRFSWDKMVDVIEHLAGR